MGPSYMTKHALERRDQRGFSQTDVELILEFGDCRPCKNNGQSYFLSKKSKSLYKQYLGNDARRKLSKLMDAYVVVSGGKVLTIANAK